MKKLIALIIFAAFVSVAALGCASTTPPPPQQSSPSMKKSDAMAPTATREGARAGTACTNCINYIM